MGDLTTRSPDLNHVNVFVTTIQTVNREVRCSAANTASHTIVCIPIAEASISQHKDSLLPSIGVGLSYNPSVLPPAERVIAQLPLIGTPI